MLLQRAYVVTDSLHAFIVSLLAPLVQEWVFTVNLHPQGYNKGTMWLEMMDRIRTCCLFEVRNFKGHALQMASIGCAWWIPAHVPFYPVANRTHCGQHMRACSWKRKPLADIREFVSQVA